MILHGRSISPGKATGTVLRLDEPLSFLGGVDGTTGELRVSEGNVAGKILVFPRGKGSTVGSFVMYDLDVHGKSPAAVVNEQAETIVATGAVISSIPMVDSVPISLFRSGDRVTVDGDRGEVEIHDVSLVDCVSSVLVRDGKILMLRRPSTAKSFPNRWSLVSGHVEPGETPPEAAVREIGEETRLIAREPIEGEEMEVREGETIWRVHPFLFSADGDPIINEENEEWRWVTPDSIPEYVTVDGVTEIVESMLSISINKG